MPQVTQILAFLASTFPQLGQVVCPGTAAGVGRAAGTGAGNSPASVWNLSW